MVLVLVVSNFGIVFAELLQLVHLVHLDDMHDLVDVEELETLDEPRQLDEEEQSLSVVDKPIVLEWNDWHQVPEEFILEVCAEDASLVDSFYSLSDAIVLILE